MLGMLGIISHRNSIPNAAAMQIQTHFCLLSICSSQFRQCFVASMSHSNYNRFIESKQCDIILTYLFRQMGYICTIEWVYMVCIWGTQTPIVRPLTIWLCSSVTTGVWRSCTMGGARDIWAKHVWAAKLILKVSLFR